jgi:hypothetical protein
MAEFAEEILRQRVWYWLETEMGMQVDAEVELGTGRIDLVGESAGEVWGIEVKVGEFGTEQVDRYAESDALDRLYVASGKKLDPEDDSIDVRALSQIRKRLRAGMAEGWYSREEIEQELTAALSREEQEQEIGSQTVYGYVLPFEQIESDKTPISLEDAVRRTQNAIAFSGLGIIHVPSASLREAMSPGDAPAPVILQEASELSRTKTVEFARREEPWVRHWLWRAYGGLPEGHIPNVLESDQPYRPIDLITFEGSDDPTAAVENPTDNKVIGFEAKGEGSFSTRRLKEQLTQFLETSTLSRLFLGVPDSIEAKAVEFISSHPEFDQVGVVTVATDGSVTTVQPAETMIPEHDGYLERQTGRKTGYGDELPAEIDDTVTAPYITDEEAIRLKYTDPAPIADELRTNEFEDLDANGYVTPAFTSLQRPPLDELIDNASATRVYVLEGDTVSEKERKQGLVEMKLSYFNDEDILLLGFTRYMGAYIWFTGEELDLLQSVLHSIEFIDGGSVPGQGYIYAADTQDRWIQAQSDPDVEAPDTPSKAYYSEAADYEERIELAIHSHVTDLEAAANEDRIVTFRLGGDGEGADLAVSKAQLVDLIASIEIAREHSGKTAELPKRETDSWSQARIAQSGDLVEDVDEIDYRSDVIR